MGSKDKDASRKLFLEGLDYFDTGKFERAERRFLAAHQLTPERLSVLNNLVSTLLKNGRLGEARRYSELAIKIDRDDALTVTNAAVLALELGQLREGRNDLKNYQNLNSDPTMLTVLGQLYQMDCEFELAIRTFQNAIDAGACRSDLLRSIEICLSELGHFEELNRLLFDFLSDHPDDDKALYMYASHADRNEIPRLEKTLGNFERIVGKDHYCDNPRYLLAKAYYYHLQKNYCKAWELCVAGKAIGAAIFSKELEAEYRYFENRFEISIMASPAPRSLESDAPVSLFILGASRSGKSTLEAMFCSVANCKRGFENSLIKETIRSTTKSWDVPAHFSNLNIPKNLESVWRDKYVEEVKYRVGAAEIFSCTKPGYISIAHRIAEIIPNSRFVFVKRNIDDVCMRIFMYLYEEDNYYSYDYDALRACVERYHKCIDLLIGVMPDRCMVTSFEAMVNEPVATVERIAALCGVSCDPSTLKQCPDDIGFANPYVNLTS